MLHLQAGVDLEERHGAVRGDQELHRAGAGVACLAADGLGGVVDLAGLVVAEERCGRLFHELLVPALERAVAGSDDDDVAVRVSEDLRLDVARPVEVALDKTFAATEGCYGLADGRVVQVVRLRRGAAIFMPRPPPPNAALMTIGQAVLLGKGSAPRPRP